MEEEGGAKVDEEVSPQEGEDQAGAPRPRRHLSRLVWKALGLLLAVGVLYLVASFVEVHRASRLDEARSVDAIVVLGAAQYHGRPSPVFERRLLHALELYQEGRAQTIVTTGAKQTGDRVTEGYAGFHYLRRRGVPEEHILVVVHGEDTWEELTATAHVLSSRGLRSVLLVSDPYHSLRAKRSATEAGLEAYVSPTDAAPTFRRLARESLAVAAGRIIGYRRVSQLR